MNRPKTSEFNCPVEVTLAVVGGRWKSSILWHLRSEKRRYSELQKLMPQITKRILTAKLRELESDQVIDRKVYVDTPQRVEYSLTAKGKTLRPVLDALCQWATTNDRTTVLRTRK